MGWPGDGVMSQMRRVLLNLLICFYSSPVSNGVCEGHIGGLGSIIKHGCLTMTVERCQGLCISSWLIGSFAVWILAKAEWVID